MSFLLGLFGLLSMIVGAFLCLGLMARDLIGIGGAVLFTGGWLMMGLSAILDNQTKLHKAVLESAGKSQVDPSA